MSSIVMSVASVFDKIVAKVKREPSLAFGALFAAVGAILGPDWSDTLPVFLSALIRSRVTPA